MNILQPIVGFVTELFVLLLWLAMIVLPWLVIFLFLKWTGIL